MSRIVFQIRRDVPWHRDKPLLSYFFGDSLKKAVTDDCFASLEVNGQKLDERQTTWGRGLTPTSLLSFIDRYRNQPGNARPEQNIQDGLHSFLFAERIFDAQFAASLAADAANRERSEIFLRGDSSSLPLIVNIPWELADAVGVSLGRPQQESALLGTLGSLQLARVISNTTARLASKPERLRVLYCVSQPPALEQIQASDFQKAIESVLKERSGMLSYWSVVGRDFTPTFNQLKAGVEEAQPHVLIVVCHGQTVEGVPQLCFEKWHAVSSLANELATKGKTFLVLLIACDQTHLAENPAAHSGAVVLLENGILSVVAMQSSVDALLAAEFLGTTLDWFFQNGAIALAVTEGRKSMAPTADDARAYADWSFPALFLTDDAHQQTDKLKIIIEAYVPTLNEMLRHIPRPYTYLPREHVDKPLSDFLRSGVVGLIEVFGGKYTGKSTAVCHSCRNALEQAIARRDTTTRPILYVDFGRYGQNPETARDLMEILRKQTEELQPHGVGPPLLDWTIPRGADGEGRAEDSMQQLVRFIDTNKMVLVIDNNQRGESPFWPEFLKSARTLNHSLVMRVGETPLATGATAFQVLPFSYEETREYVESFAPQHAAAADSWFKQTGGLPGLIELLRRSANEGSEVGSMASSGFTHNLPESEQDILYSLVQLPNGVDQELASAYVAAEWRDLLRLAQRGLLLRESRFDVSSSWFRLPQILMHSLQSDTEKIAQAAQSLADRFFEQISSDEARSVEERLIKLAQKSGGIDFLQNIHQVLINLEYREQAHALPLILHEWLFGHGRWYEAYTLWERLLSKSSFDETQAHEWIKLARAAHVLGMSTRAEEFVAKAEASGLTPLDEIDVLILRPILIKDSGETRRSDEVTALYDQILELIGILQTNGSDISVPDLEQRRALTLYNRALHRLYWLHDSSGAFSDLDQARTAFAQLGMERMQALADCEWVDIQLDLPEHEKDWTEMLERLIKANAVFASGGDSPGDRAFCYYQIARYYRRKPSETEDNRENILKARDAYRKASEQACIAGDVRQREIAEGHLVEVCWRDLGEINAEEASKRLETVIDLLGTFAGDAWSIRVRRDMLLIQSRLMRDLRPDGVLAAYKDTWDAARQPPLHPGHGTDAHRAARILFEYLRELESSGQRLEIVEVAVLAQNFIEQWLGHAIDPEERKAWVTEVEQFGKGPGEYYGQPKR